jgi:hypothetical protein
VRPPFNGILGYALDRAGKDEEADPGEDIQVHVIRRVFIDPWPLWLYPEIEAEWTIH